MAENVESRKKRSLAELSLPVKTVRRNVDRARERTSYANFIFSCVCLFLSRSPRSTTNVNSIDLISSDRRRIYIYIYIYISASSIIQIYDYSCYPARELPDVPRGFSSFQRFIDARSFMVLTEENPALPAQCLLVKMRLICTAEHATLDVTSTHGKSASDTALIHEDVVNCRSKIWHDIGTRITRITWNNAMYQFQLFC